MINEDDMFEASFSGSLDESPCAPDDWVPWIPPKGTAAPAGHKESDGKLRVDLIAPEMTEGIAQVLGGGVAKYGERNWELGLPICAASLAAAKRHILKFELGIDKDEETNLCHLLHAFTNLGMAYTNYLRYGEGVDDRRGEP